MTISAVTYWFRVQISCELYHQWKVYSKLLIVVPGSRNPTKHHRSRGSMQMQWGTLLQARAGALFTQWRRSPKWKRQIFFILYSRGSGKGSLRGLANSCSAAGEAGSLGGVRVGWGTFPPFLDCLGVEGNLSPSDWLAWKSFFLLLGRGFYSEWQCYLKWSRFKFFFHTKRSIYYFQFIFSYFFFF